MKASATTGSCDFCGSQVVAETAEDQTDIREELDVLKRRDEVRELDARWREERDKLKVSRKDGSRTRPTKGGAIAVILMFLAFAVVSSLMIGAADRRRPNFTTPQFSTDKDIYVDSEGNLRSRSGGEPIGLGGRPIETTPPSRGLSFMSLFPLLAGAIGLIVGILHFQRAAAYDRAEERYRRKRRALMSD